jgi:predicted nucleic acid-binding protein
MSSSAALRAGKAPLYGVDTMLFVYHFEGNEEFGLAAGRVLKAAEEGRIHLITSVLSLLEVLVVPKRKKNQELCRLYREFFESFPNLRVLPIDSEVAEIASDLRAEQGLRTPDSLHVATAIRAGAGAFISQDLGLRRLQAIPFASLSEISLPSER